MFPEERKEQPVREESCSRSQHALGMLGKSGADLLKLVCDGFGLFMPLEPHHVLCVEPPGLLLQGFGCQILGLGALRRGSRNM